LWKNFWKFRKDSAVSRSFKHRRFQKTVVRPKNWKNFAPEKDRAESAAPRMIRLPAHPGMYSGRWGKPGFLTGFGNTFTGKTFPS
jgi:hypothetical protein